LVKIFIFKKGTFKMQKFYAKEDIEIFILLEEKIF